MNVFVVWFGSDFWMLAEQTVNLNPASRACVKAGEGSAKVQAKANRKCIVHDVCDVTCMHELK